jgi:hypothetical protein
MQGQEESEFYNEIKHEQSLFLAFNDYKFCYSWRTLYWFNIIVEWAPWDFFAGFVKRFEHILNYTGTRLNLAELV